MKQGRLLFAGSEQCADLLYLCGFRAGDPFLYLETSDVTHIIVSAMEIERARRQCRPGVQPISCSDAARQWGIPSKAPVTYAALFAAFAKKSQIWRWETSGNFPYDAALRFKKELKEAAPARTAVSLLPCKQHFAPGRLRKSREEIEKIRHAERLAEKGLARAEVILQEAAIADTGILIWNHQSLTAEILRGEINAEITRHGGQAAHTIVAPGVQGACPHNEGTGVIPANQPIVLDIFPQDTATGYFGDLTRTLVKGHASETVRKAFQTVYDIQRRISETLRPGILGKDIQKMTEDFFREKGYRTNMKARVPYGFIHSVGHGIGLEIHELPTLSSRGDIPLEAGNVVSNEPGLYYPAWGGIRIEDALAITEDGADNLAIAPVYLEIP